MLKSQSVYGCCVLEFGGVAVTMDFRMRLQSALEKSHEDGHC